MSATAPAPTYAAVLHLHTWRCKHAQGDAIDMVAAAVAGGCTRVGLSDHTPLPDGSWPEVRMGLDQLDDYVAAVRQAEAAFPQATVLLGMECDWHPEYERFYRDELRGRIGCDYLIAAAHAVPCAQGRLSPFYDRLGAGGLRAYADMLIRGMESGLVAFVAHPDVFACGMTAFDADCAAVARDLALASVATGVPLELNANGLRRSAPADGRPGPYPWRPFWEIVAAHGAKVVLSSDAHRPSEVLHGFAELDALRQELGLVAVDPTGD